jgi:outer membrane protein OmpA-like peptidoglycan-associated protein
MRIALIAGLAFAIGAGPAAGQVRDAPDTIAPHPDTTQADPGMPGQYDWARDSLQREGMQQPSDSLARALHEAMQQPCDTPLLQGQRDRDTLMEGRQMPPDTAEMGLPPGEEQETDPLEGGEAAPDRDTIMPGRQANPDTMEWGLAAPADLMDAIIPFGQEEETLGDSARAMLDGWLQDRDADPATRFVVVYPGTAGADVAADPAGATRATRRAEAVRAYLIARGIEPRRIQIATPDEVLAPAAGETSRVLIIPGC